jgi:amidase
MKPELVWNIEKGLTLTAAELIHAEHLRAKMFRNMLTFFNEYDLLLCPTTIVPPFPVAQRFVDSCNGVSFSNYIEWLGIAYAVSLVACPAMSLPCGFTATGMPVGMQIIGRPHADAQVFSAGRLLEDYFELNTSRPISPRAFTSREC